MTAPLRSVPVDDDRLLRAVERLTHVLENLPNQLARVGRGEACVSTMNKLMTADEFAEVLDLDTRTVRRLVREGELPAPFKVGGALRWRRVDIERWLAEKQP